MKERMHIPHNYEMRFEIRQEGIPCSCACEDGAP